EPGSREEGEGDQHEARVAIASRGDIRHVGKRDADRSGQQDDPEMARMVLPLQVQLGADQEECQADEWQRHGDRHDPRDLARARRPSGRSVRRHPRRIRPASARAGLRRSGIITAMTERILSARALNRALLARQLLLERASVSIPEAVEQVGGLQTQYAPSGYVGLWTRLADFRRDALTDALEDRSVVQATLLRVTIHMVSRREYWRYALGVRKARRVQWR